MPEHELENLKHWLQDKDYCFLNNLTVLDYLVELEERLTLYHFALLAGGLDVDDVRWKKINRGQLCLKQASYTYSLKTETKDICTIKGKFLPFHQAIHEQMKQNLQKFPQPTFGDNIREYNKARKKAINQTEYLSPMDVDRKQLLLCVDLENASDESLLKQFAFLLPQLREKLEIPEPAIPPKQGRKKQDKIGAVKKLRNHKTIQYLDIMLYCRMASPVGETWHLTDPMLDLLLFNGERGSESMKEYRVDFFVPKVLDEEFIHSLFNNIRSDPYNAKELMSSL